MTFHNITQSFHPLANNKWWMALRVSTLQTPPLRVNFPNTRLQTISNSRRMLFLYRQPAGKKRDTSCQSYRSVSGTGSYHQTTIPVPYRCLRNITRPPALYLNTTAGRSRFFRVLERTPVPIHSGITRHFIRTTYRFNNIQNYC